MDPSRPFGFATYRTTAALKNIRIRELTADEVKAGAQGDDAQKDDGAKETQKGKEAK